MGVDSVVGDMSGVYSTGSCEMARLRGIWGELSGWNGLWGCSDGLGSVLCHSRVMAHGSEWRRVGGSAVVDKHVNDDMAVVPHILGCSTRVKGAS